MDRVIVYDGALPQTSDILYTNKFGMVGQAFQNAAILGTSTVVAGLGIAPTSPASLSVTIDRGSIYAIDNVDPTAYSSLGIDTTSVMKQGILYTPKVLTITPPATAGYSQVYLVQASLTDVDGGLSVLSYYNSGNPAVPFAGANNDGMSQFTRRNNPCNISLKAGVAAATGTQTTPAVDAGYVGLYAITVSNGQTQITTASIAQLDSAPFFPTLPSMPAAIQQQLGNFAIDTGSANVAVVKLPYYTVLKPGMPLRVLKMALPNTGPMSITVNGVNYGLVGLNNVALVGGDWPQSSIAELFFDGTNFRMGTVAGRPLSLPAVWSARNSTAQSMGNGLNVNLVPGADQSIVGIGTMTSGVITFSRPGLYLVTFDATLTETVVGANVIGGQLSALHNSVAAAGSAPGDSAYVTASGSYNQWLSMTVPILSAGGDTVWCQGKVYANSSFTSGQATGFGASIFTLW